MSPARKTVGPRLDIRLLGPPEVLVDGRPLAVDTRKAIAILALLAADGRPYARDELAALLWPESDEPSARGALRRTLSTMRSAIGDGPLRIDRAQVDLDRRQVHVDLADVEAAAHTDDRPTLAAAAREARGAFLAGFNLRDSPDFDDWRATRAVAAERSILTVLDRLATAAQADGDLATAIDAIGRRLELDPLDEAGHVRLMDLLVIADDRSGALRQYRACVAVLERELGVAPLASTTARYEAIRDEPDAPPDARPVATAPAPDPVAALPLVGRSSALETLLAVHAGLRGSAGAIVAVIGEAGIGKTRLADEAVASIATRGAAVLRATAHPAERGIAYGAIVELLRSALALPDGEARRLALDPATAAELGRLLPAIGGRGVPAAPADGPGAHARLVAAIADGLTTLVRGGVPGILWVDDVQWTDTASLEALAFLARRLARHPVLLLLAWRPEDLDADGVLFTDRLHERPGTTSIDLDRLDRDAIVALVRSARPELTDAGLADRLATISEGLPLYVVEALAGPRDASPEDLPPTVGAVLRERLASVPETASQILSAASVIGREFDLPTVRYASGRSEDEAIDAVERCVARGLIRETAAGFDFAHGALRDLAYEATGLTRRRLLHRRVAEALRLDLSRNGRDDLARLVLIAGHERAAGRDAEAAAAYRAAGDRAAEVYANREAIDHYGAALGLGDPDAVGLHVAIGRLRTRLGDYAGAIAAFEAAAAQASPAELPELEWSLARAHLRRGDLVAAARHLDAAAVDADDRLLARIDVDRSVVRRRDGDPAGAGEAARSALTAADRTADVVAAGAAHRMLGLVALDTGDVDAAIAELGIAARTAADDPDPTAGIAARVALALAWARAGDLDAAVAQAGVAIETCRRIGDRHLEAAAENHLADLLHEAGRDAEARPHQLRAIEAFAELGGSPADPDPGIWMLAVS